MEQAGAGWGGLGQAGLGDRQAVICGGGAVRVGGLQGGRMDWDLGRGSGWCLSFNSTVVMLSWFGEAAITKTIRGCIEIIPMW